MNDNGDSMEDFSSLSFSSIIYCAGPYRRNISPSSYSSSAWASETSLSARSYAFSMASAAAFSSYSCCAFDCETDLSSAISKSRLAWFTFAMKSALSYSSD